MNYRVKLNQIYMCRLSKSTWLKPLCHHYKTATHNAKELSCFVKNLLGYQGGNFYAYSIKLLVMLTTGLCTDKKLLGLCLSKACFCLENKVTGSATLTYKPWLVNEYKQRYVVSHSQLQFIRQFTYKKKFQKKPWFVNSYDKLRSNISHAVSRWGLTIVNVYSHYQSYNGNIV